MDRLSYQQVTQSNAAVIVFPLAVMLAFLVLAALYESWTLPLAVILIVPVCMCAGAARCVALPARQQCVRAGRPGGIDGPGCKNAILIVELRGVGSRAGVPWRRR